MPDTGRPEVAYVYEDGAHEVRDISAPLTGKVANKTIRLCQKILKKETEVKYQPTQTHEVANPGQVYQNLGLAAGEKPLVRGTVQDVRPGFRIKEYVWNPEKRRWEALQTPVSIIVSALPPQKRYTNADIGAGLTGQARKTARRRAFQKLSALYRELLAYFNMPEWATKTGENCYMARDYLLDRIQRLIDRLWGSYKYWDYYDKLTEIVTESQSLCRW